MHDPPNAMLEILMLGGASFFAGRSVVRSEFGRAGRLLACFLFAFAGRAHRRERLAGLFWGDIEEDKARAALNSAVWRIRKMLELARSGGGRCLITVGDDVVMEPAEFIRVDSQVLQTAAKRAAECARGCRLDADEEEEISAGLNAYAGPFLDGYDGDWIVQERERLHCLFVRSTIELMRAAARRGDHECALDFARKIIAVDPLREDVQRDLMLLLVQNGQRAEAIRRYQTFRNILKAELCIDPMPDTRRLHDDIRSGNIFENLEVVAASRFGTPP